MRPAGVSTRDSGPGRLSATRETAQDASASHRSGPQPPSKLFLLRVWVWVWVCRRKKRESQKDTPSDSGFSLLEPSGIPPLTNEARSNGDGQNSQTGFLQARDPRNNRLPASHADRLASPCSLPWRMDRPKVVRGKRRDEKEGGEVCAASKKAGALGCVWISARGWENAHHLAARYKGESSPPALCMHIDLLQPHCSAVP